MYKYTSPNIGVTTISENMVGGFGCLLTDNMSHV